MIVEGKKITAFDAMEAAMNLSGIYMVHNRKESVTFRYSQPLESVCFEFGKWNGYEFEITKKFCVPLDDLTNGDSFSDVFDMIEKELDRMAELEKEEFKA